MVGSAAVSALVTSLTASQEYWSSIARGQTQTAMARTMKESPGRGRSHPRHSSRLGVRPLPTTLRLHEVFGRFAAPLREWKQIPPATHFPPARTKVVLLLIALYGHRDSNHRGLGSEIFEDDWRVILSRGSVYRAHAVARVEIGEVLRLF